MRKFGKKICCIFCAFSLSICLSGCGQEEEDYRNIVLTPIPSINELEDPWKYLEVLDAEDINQTNDAKWYIDEINKIVHNTPGYERAYTDLLAFVDTATETKDFDLYQQKECYVSNKPIMHWEAKWGCISEVEIDLFIFSKDLKKTALYSVDYQDEKYLTGSIMDATGDTRWETFQKNKKTKYIFIGNGPREILLNAKNEILMDNKPYIQVKGDYYHKLDYKNMAVSYQELTDKKNLVKLDLDYFDE